MQRKTKIITAILIICTIAVSTVALVWAYYASYSRNLSWTVANTQFEVDVNGTQIDQTSSNGFGPVTSSSTYCEVYTLTNRGDVPITITGVAALTASSVGTATVAWMGGPVAALGPGAVTDVVLEISDFSAAGTVQVSFTDVPTYPGATKASQFVLTETNDADSSPQAPGSPYWALDSFAETVQIYNLGGNNYAAFVDYVGSWQTFANVLSPGNGVASVSGGSGPMVFSYVSTFTYTGTYPTIPATLTQDMGGSYTSPNNAVTANTVTFSWYNTYFSGYTGYTEPFGELAYYQYGTLVYNSIPNAQIWTGFGSGHGDIVT